jgi:hypothetical protein
MLVIGRWWMALQLGLSLGLLMLPAPARAAPAEVGPWSVCDGAPWLASSTCEERPLRDVNPQGRVLWLTAKVRVNAPASEPAAVFVSAYASSAAYWDGKLIGMNGRPSERGELEKPGLRDAVFPFSNAIPGDHRLTLKMSSHKGIWHLRSPVTDIRVAPFERPSSTLMRDYLPALVSAGGLLIMILIFAFVSWGGEGRRSRAYLLGAALFATGQLGAEASRAFLEYPYPMLFLRIVLVLAFAIGFGFMLLAYLARRFEVARFWPILLAQTIGGGLAIFLVPSFDHKTGLVLSSALAIGMLVAIHAATRSAPGALPLVAMLALGLIFSVAEPHSFLNRELYLWTAGLFVLLFAGDARRMKAAPVETDEGAALRSPASAGPAGLWLGAGAGRRFLLPADIVRVAAADDYSELFLVDGGSVLDPEPLQKLLERLPAGFLRVHRSHAINLSHLRSFRKGPSSSVVLSDQSIAPVSRRRVATVLAALDG